MRFLLKSSTALLIVLAAILSQASVSRHVASAEGSVSGGATGIVKSLPFAPFDLTDQLSGPIFARASRTVFPEGMRFTHAHGGFIAVYVVSGTLEVIRPTGSTTYNPGDFFVEVPGVEHTAHAISRVEILTVGLVPPGTATTTAVTLVGGSPQATPFNSVDLTGQLASGPLALRGSRNVFPAGFTFTHTHSGPTFVYVLSGSVEVSAETGTVDHPAGSLFFEPAAHVHTLHVPKGAELISVTLSPPIMATTQGIMRVVPIITAYGPTATSSSFTG